MPSDPIINEGMLLEHLRDRSPITPNAMRALCGLSLAACFDRQVKRPFFIEMLDLVTSIQVDLSYLEKAGAMRAFLTEQDEERDPTVLDAEIKKLVAGFMSKRRVLAEKIELVAQCPTTADPIS